MIGLFCGLTQFDLRWFVLVLPALPVGAASAAAARNKAARRLSGNRGEGRQQSNLERGKLGSVKQRLGEL